MAIKSNKTVFYWNLVIKLIFAVILVFFIYRQLFHNNDIDLSWKHFKSNLGNGESNFVLLCILLMPLNWLLESKKWQILVLPFENISLTRSFKAILSGISVALLTPNRIGEYGGRMLMVKAKNNWKAVISTLISSYAQNVWNIGIGLIAAMFLLSSKGDLESYLFLSGLVVSILFLVIIIFLFFNIDFINHILKRFKKYKLVEKSLFHLRLLKEYNYSSLAKALLFALGRYLVYLLQYYFILRFFGLDITLINAFIGIACIFLVQTSLPLPPVLGFLARGEIALLVWEGYEFNDLSVLASSYFLWFLNLILPSVLGAMIIFTSNLSRTLGLTRNYFK